jgi:RNA polymerase sigma-70 factor (ECF subfamily)
MKEPSVPDTDHDIILRCQRGDVEAFEGIVAKYEQKMFNVSYRLLGDYNEAAEVTQDAFVSAYRGLRGFRGRAKFSTWLYTIVVNLSRNRLKRLKTDSGRIAFSFDDPVETDDRAITRETASGDPSALERLETSEIQVRVQGCIKSLERDFREVVVLRDIQGLSYDEISSVLDIAEGTVKSRLHRARIALRDCLKRVTGDM